MKTEMNDEVGREPIAQWVYQGESMLRGKTVRLSEKDSRELGWRANKTAGKIGLLSTNRFLERFGQDKI